MASGVSVKETIFCARCAVPFTAFPSDQRKYCGQLCSDLAQFGFSRTDSVEARFRANYTVAESGCHEWAGAINNTGYGAFRWRGRTTSPHRLIWTLDCGPIPEGLQVCHHCDNRRCMKLGHLFLGTAQDNATDMVQKGRAHRRDICPAGHDLAVTAMQRSEGGRRCRVCYKQRQRESDKRRYWEKKAEATV